MLAVYDLPGWPWQPDKCPADDHFIDWLNYEVINGEIDGPIFHMGTGLHHAVGMECVFLGLGCIGLTASEEEYNSLPDTNERGGKGHYAIVLGNLYKLDALRVEYFQIMTLFHLGELVELFGDIDYEAVDAVMSLVRPSGLVFFYTGSSAWDRASAYVGSCVEREILQ